MLNKQIKNLKKQTLEIIKEIQYKMENLPTEVLEMVFCPLSSLYEIEKCFKTCRKWKKILRNMFKNKGQ